MTNGVHPTVYRPAPMSYLGDGFEAMTTHRQVEIGFGSKRFHFAMRSSRFRRSTRPAGGGNGGSILWRAMGYVGCASLALGLVFVSGGMLRASSPVDPYAVVMPIDAKVAGVVSKHKARPRQIVRAKPVVPFAPAANIDENWSVSPATEAAGGDPGIARPDPDVATLPTVNGERAVAVYGPSRLVGGKSCRDVSVFVRGTDGKVGVSPTTECKAAR